MVDLLSCPETSCRARVQVARLQKDHAKAHLEVKKFERELDKSRPELIRAQEEKKHAQTRLADATEALKKAKKVRTESCMESVRPGAHRRLAKEQGAAGLITDATHGHSSSSHCAPPDPALLASACQLSRCPPRPH